MTNMRIRQEMLKAGFNQGDVAKILGISEPKFSNILNEYDLSAKAQADIIEKIREAAKAKEGQA